jgi:protein-tyrosine phosphatase
VREWLTSFELAKQGLYLSLVLETPRLFISDVASAGARELLAHHQIGAILSLVPQPFERVTLSEAKGASIDRYRVTDTTHGPYKDPNLARYYISLADDGTNTPQQLIAAFELLEDICRAHPETGILVHGQAGLSRSVSLVAALVAKSLKCTFEDAVRSLAKHRQVGIHEDLAVTLTHALGIQLDRES